MKTGALLAVLAAVGALVILDAPDDKPAVNAKAAPRGTGALPQTPDALAAAASARAVPQAQDAPANQPALGAALPERSGLGESTSPLFSTQSWQPPPPKAAPPPPPPPPTAPALPFRFVGRMVQDGQLFIFLAKGDAIVTAKQGDTIDGAYRVDSVTETEVALTYTPLGQKQTLAVVSSLPGALSGSGAAASTGTPANLSSGPSVPPARTAATGPVPTAKVIAQPPSASAPAQLEWGGPKQVKVGATFEVSLRVKSDETLHAWPMQLRFDPTLFDVVTVKPGSTVAGPTFGYRVNEDGSIFVGASAQSGTRAANTELVVITLKSIKPAPSAEVSVAAVTLEGAAGRPIAHDRIAAFRTAIVP